MSENILSFIRKYSIKVVWKEIFETGEMIRIAGLFNDVF